MNFRPWKTSKRHAICSPVYTHSWARKFWPLFASPRFPILSKAEKGRSSWFAWGGRIKKKSDRNKTHHRFPRFSRISILKNISLPRDRRKRKRSVGWPDELETCRFGKSLAKLTFFVARWTCLRGRENEGVAPSPRLFLSFQLGMERQNPHWETFLLKIAHSHVKMGQKFCAQGRVVGINATGEKVWSGGRSIFFFSSFLAGTIEGNFQSNFVAAYCWFFPYFY